MRQHKHPIRHTEQVIKPLTDVLQAKKLKLLGHIMRRLNTHPQFQVTFKSKTGRVRCTNKRRVGRPRNNSAKENLRKAWAVLRQANEVSDEPLDLRNREHRGQLFDRAINYVSPFGDTKSKR